MNSNGKRSVGEGVGQSERAYATVGRINEYNHFEKLQQFLSQLPKPSAEGFKAAEF